MGLGVATPHKLFYPMRTYTYIEEHIYKLY